MLKRARSNATTIVWASIADQMPNQNQLRSRYVEELGLQDLGKFHPAMSLVGIDIVHTTTASPRLTNGLGPTNVPLLEYFT